MCRTPSSRFLLGIFLCCLTVAQGAGAAAQSAGNKPDTGLSIYTFVYNNVSDPFHFPLIGVINIAKSNHQTLQIGLLNWNRQNFTGGQLSLINTIGSSFKGAQLGVINTVGDTAAGVQLGVVNTVGGNGDGFQAGLVNTCATSLQGAQVGLINIVGEDLTGPQIGLVNISGNHTQGLQLGLVNTSNTLHGLQLGVVNYAESVERGFPVGLVSVVRRGGYRALELGATETYPLNASFKLGTNHFYTSFVASSDTHNQNQWAFGLGIGTLVPLWKILFFNPELHSQSTTSKPCPRQLITLSSILGFSLTSKLQLLMGPSIVWKYTQEGQAPLEPLFPLVQRETSPNSTLSLGFRLSLRVPFS